MSDCIFCDIIKKAQPASIVHEDEHTLAFMDIFPNRPGHVLIVPKLHQQYVAQLDAATRAHLFETANRVANAVRQSSLKPDAVHFLVNDGVAAHQTVPHVHMHVLPRYKGDHLKFLLSIFHKPVKILFGLTRRNELDRLAQEYQALMK
ncbi:MAG TPA: HIT family protein [Pseudomonadales bacterium]|nr:HIT family protein [Pseudomonadales bacterium]